MNLLDEFKKDIIEKEKSKLNDIVEDYLISRSNWYFDKTDKKEYNLKNEIKQIFGIDINNIFFVGSSKVFFLLVENVPCLSCNSVCEAFSASSRVL